MRELSLIVLEMERQGKRLNRLLRVAHLNTLTWPEFQELVTIIERLQVDLTDFNVASLRPRDPDRRTKEKAPPRLMLRSFGL